MAMGAAALNDAAAWCLLVLAISLGQIAADRRLTHLFRPLNLHCISMH